eukprot:COSAG01_NODE_57048_length_316_cov_3.800000_1_plen_76_part_01
MRDAQEKSARQAQGTVAAQKPSPAPRGCTSQPRANRPVPRRHTKDARIRRLAPLLRAVFTDVRFISPHPNPPPPPP